MKNVSRCVPEQWAMGKSCYCLPSSLITDETGEIFCSKCGTVQGREILQETQNSSQLNLYLETELGGPSSELNILNPKIHIYSSDVSSLSNICDKLAIPQFIRKEIWRTYQVLKKETNLTKAKASCLAIFHTCRKNKFPLIEKQVIQLIKLNFNVKNVPSFLSVVSEANSIIIKGIPVLQKIGINTSTDHSAEYYLNSALIAIKNDFTSEQFQIIRAFAIKVFPRLTGNSDTNAKKAIMIAKKRIGL